MDKNVQHESSLQRVSIYWVLGPGDAPVENQCHPSLPGIIRGLIRGKSGIDIPRSCAGKLLAAQEAVERENKQRMHEWKYMDLFANATDSCASALAVCGASDLVSVSRLNKVFRGGRPGNDSERMGIRLCMK